MRKNVAFRDESVRMSGVLTQAPVGSAQRAVATGKTGRFLPRVTFQLPRIMLSHIVHRHLAHRPAPLEESSSGLSDPEDQLPPHITGGEAFER